MPCTWNIDNGLSIKSTSVTHSKNIIFIGPIVLGILTLIVEFDLQIRFVIHINMILVCKCREQKLFKALTY